jgi:hypothetical protein
MSNYTKKVVTWEMVEAALDDIDARLAALEGKGGEARMATPDEIRQHDVGVVWEHIDALKEENAELERRLTEATAPTKRQQVAEAFLHAAETFSLDTEGRYEHLAEIIDAQTRKPNTLPRERAMFTAMAAVLEEAAREEQDA